MLQKPYIYIYDDKESASLKYLLNFKMNFTIQEELINTIFEHYFNENDVLGELYMSENEIIDLSKKGFLGSHTHNHFPVGLLSEDEMKFELENSKHFFENLTNSKIEMVAYPYGTPEACTNEVAKMAKDVGYKLGFTTTRGINTSENNLLLLDRFDCNDLPGGKNYKI
jgi:peptidoglycan/xylan/chitin deacetylase (PgdA/CDA1 family)